MTSTRFALSPEKPVSYTQQATAARLCQEQSFAWWLHLERFLDVPGIKLTQAETKQLQQDITAIHETARALATLEERMGERWVRDWIAEALARTEPGKTGRGAA